VELDVEEIDGVPHYRSGWRRGRPIEAQRWLVLYVCPRSGLLRSAKPRIQRPPTRINVNDSLQYHMLDGAWYEVRLCKIPEETDRRWDVIVDKPLNQCSLDDLSARYGLAAYALSKRKLSASEKRALMKSQPRRDN